MPVRIVPPRPADQPHPKTGLLDDRELTKTEFDDACRDFDAYFRINGSDRIDRTEQVLLWTKLRDFVDAVPDMGPHRGLAIFLGLSGTQMVYGYRVLSFTPSGAGYAYEPSLCAGDSGTRGYASHIYDGDHFQRVTPEEWAVYRQNYLTRVTVKRTVEGGFESLDPLVDTHAIIFPWEDEMVALRAGNNDLIGNSNYHMIIDSVSLVHPAINGDCGNTTGGYRHGVCFYFEVKRLFGWEMLVRDSSEIVIYRNRAADYGNMCPPKCRYFER